MEIYNLITQSVNSEGKTRTSIFPFIDFNKAKEKAISFSESQKVISGDSIIEQTVYEDKECMPMVPGFEFEHALFATLTVTVFRNETSMTYRAIYKQTVIE